MQEFQDDPQEKYTKLKKRLKDLNTLVQYNHSPARERELRKEILRLEKSMEQIRSVYALPTDYDDLDDDGPQFPMLQAVEETLQKNDSLSECIDEELCDLQNYLFFFEKEFLPLLSKRQLKLDFNYSLARDSFYDMYLQTNRMVTEHCDELERWHNSPSANNQESFFKQQEFKRKHQVLLRCNEFFEKVEIFCTDLIHDIEENGTSCLNSEHILEFSAYENAQYINYIPVSEALKKLQGFAAEVQSYINLPDF